MSNPPDSGATQPPTIEPPNVRQSNLRAWMLASRPKTLTAAFVPVAVGSATAWASGHFTLGPALAALLGAFLIQIGTNFANDYFDFQKGADTEARIGPTRAVAAGLLSPAAVRRAMIVVFAFASLVGAYLVVVGGWPILVIGVLSILSGIAYTGGPFPLGYHGLGDLFVFVFFGLVAVAGTDFVQRLSWSTEALIAGIPIGCLAVAILIVNNTRDIDTDRAAGKRTLAVRLGRTASVAEYALVMTVAYLVPIGEWWFGGGSAWRILPCLTLPWAIAMIRTLAIRREGPVLNRLLESTAKLLLVFGILYALGIVLSAPYGVSTP